MQICLGCGSENNDIVQFCIECGEELTLENIAGDDVELESLRKRRYQLKKKLEIRPERYKHLKKEWKKLSWRKRTSKISSRKRREIREEQEQLRKDIYDFYKQDDEENNELESIERILNETTDLPNFCSHCGKKWKKVSARCSYCGSLIL